MNRQLKKIFLFFVALVMIACSKTQHRHNEISKIQITSGPCFGGCPEETVSIDSALNFYYTVGHRQLKENFKGKITSGFWDTLNIKFEQVHYKDLKKYYPEHSSDGRTWSVVLRYRGIKKYIEAEESGLPDSLHRLLGFYMASHQVAHVKPYKGSVRYDKFIPQRTIDVRTIRFPPKF